MNIKNKPVVNRDPQSALIAQLRQQVTVLQNDSQKCRALLKDAGIKVEDIDQQLGNNPSAALVSAVNSQELQTLRSANHNLERKLEQLHGEMLKDRKRLNEAEI